MNKIKNCGFFRVISLILIITFISLDISYAYPPELSANSATLAAPSLFQQQPINDHAARFQQSVFSQGVVLASVYDIGEYFFNKDEKSATPLPSKYAEEVVKAGIGKILGNSGIEILNIVPVEYLKNTVPEKLNSALSEIGFKGTLPDEGVAFILYKKDDKKFLVQIAEKAKVSAVNLPGYEWVVSDKYVVKYVPENYDTSQLAASVPVIARPAEQAEAISSTDVAKESPRATISEPIAQVEAPISQEEEVKGASRRVFDIKAIITIAVIMLLFPLTAFGASDDSASLFSFNNIFWTITGIAALVIVRYIAKKRLMLAKAKAIINEIGITISMITAFSKVYEVNRPGQALFSIGTKDGEMPDMWNTALFINTSIMRQWRFVWLWENHNSLVKKMIAVDLCQREVSVEESESIDSSLKAAGYTGRKDPNAKNAYFSEINRRAYPKVGVRGVALEAWFYQIYPNVWYGVKHFDRNWLIQQTKEYLAKDYLWMSDKDIQEVTDAVFEIDDQFVSPKKSSSVTLKSINPLAAIFGVAALGSASTVVNDFATAHPVISLFCLALMGIGIPAILLKTISSPGKEFHAPISSNKEDIFFVRLVKFVSISLFAFLMIFTPVGGLASRHPVIFLLCATLICHIALFNIWVAQHPINYCLHVIVQRNRGNDLVKDRLIKIGPAAVPAMIKILDSGYYFKGIHMSATAKARVDLIDVLGGIGDPSSIESIKRALQDDNDDVRKAAEKALAKIKSGASDKKGGSTTLMSINPLAAIFGIAALGQIVSAARDLAFAHPIITAAVALGISILAFFAIWRAFFPANWHIFWLTLSDTSKTALVKIGSPAVSDLIIALGNSKSFVRSAVAEVLGNIKDPRAVKPLIELLSDSDQYVRSVAARALDNIGWKPVTDQERIAYLIAAQKWNELVKIGPPAALYLIKLLSHSDQHVRSRIAKALDNIGWMPVTDQERIAYLIAAQKWDELVKIGPPAALYLIKLLRDRERYIRSVVAALRDINDPRLSFMKNYLEAMTYGEGYYAVLTEKNIEYIAYCLTKGLNIKARYKRYKTREVEIAHDVFMLDKYYPYQPSSHYETVVDSRARLIIEMDKTILSRSRNQSGLTVLLNNIITEVSAELQAKKEMTPQELFNLVQSKVPASMVRLTNALDELALLSGQAGLTAGAISQAIVATKTKYSLSDDETQILWLAMTGPGQGMGQISSFLLQRNAYWSLISQLPALQDLKLKLNEAAGDEFVHVEWVIAGIKALIAGDYNYLLSMAKDGTTVSPAKITEFNDVMEKLRIQVEGVVGEDDEKNNILALMPMVHDIGKVGGLNGHPARGAAMLDADIFQKLQSAGYSLPDSIKETLTLLVKHHFSIGEIFIAANLPNRTQTDVSEAIGYIDSLLADIDAGGRNFKFIVTLLLANTLGDVAQGFLPVQIFINQFNEALKYNDRAYFESVRAALAAKLIILSTPAAPGQSTGATSLTPTTSESVSVPLTTPKTVQSPKTTQLFDLVENALNNERAVFIGEGNKLIRSLIATTGTEALAGIGILDKNMATAKISQRIERTIAAINSLDKEDVTPEVRGTIELLKKNIRQFEADGGVSSMIVLARNAKREGQKLIIGLETIWIPGINVENSLQRQAITALEREIDGIAEALQSMGLDNVEIIRGSGEKLASDLLSEADKTHTKLHNIVVMASTNTINSDSFASLRNADESDRPFLAGIDPTELVKLYAEFGESVSKQLYIRLAGLLYMTLELAAGKEPPQTPMIASYDRKLRIVIFLPRAEPMDYETLKNNYKAEKTALQAA